jgi:ribosomal protein L11 methylase PrmA
VTSATISASFRDPSGFLFQRDGVLYRQVNHNYRKDYDRLIESGLYEKLVDNGSLVAHEEMTLDLALTDSAYKILQPRRIPFISYPFEWSFSQIKDSALLTLDIQQKALDSGMTLKDASAYNIQFLDGRPIFVDTLSFESYEEGAPWVAYRQFCQHFLAPLALMSRVDVRLSQLLRVHIDGVQLDLASRLLPFSTRWSLGLGLHIHLHAKSQKKYADRMLAREKIKKIISHRELLGLLDSLRTAVDKLVWKPGGTAWFDYYEANNNYGEAGLQEKERIIDEIVAQFGPKIVWDLGGNTGRFSRIATARGAFVVCWDNDPGCVEANYRMVRREKETNILPLLLDLTNPSPGIGWNNEERSSLGQRAPADLILALGLLHHLAISNNTPLPQIARFLGSLSNGLIIEFVPKEDSQVQKLLATREDIFPDYNLDGFKNAFRHNFFIEREITIPGTKRTIYFMKGR